MVVEPRSITNSLLIIIACGMVLSLVIFFLPSSIHSTAINASQTAAVHIHVAEQQYQAAAPSYTQGYLCISTNSTNYNNGNWLNVCQSEYDFQTCQGNPQSGCASADGYPDEDCGWPVGKMGVMCFTYGANPPFGTQGENLNSCDGINEGISDTC